MRPLTARIVADNWHGSENMSHDVYEMHDNKEMQAV